MKDTLFTLPIDTCLTLTLSNTYTLSEIEYCTIETDSQEHTTVTIKSTYSIRWSPYGAATAVSWPLSGGSKPSSFAAELLRLLLHHCVVPMVKLSRSSVLPSLPYPREIFPGRRDVTDHLSKGSPTNFRREDITLGTDVEGCVLFHFSLPPRASEICKKLCILTTPGTGTQY
jgi:hypothetical protein